MSGIAENTSRILLIFLCMGYAELCAQATSDADRLRKMEYMKYADRVDCDSLEFSNLEHRICLNLRFQELDSVLNDRFDSFLETIEADSLQHLFNEYQARWIQNRRLQSQVLSRGYRGHMLGIYYLSIMIETTQKRIEELEFLLGEE